MNDKKQLTIALCGNPNCGKTTLFNLLTGSNQKVGNWPGVTVERKSGICKFDENLSIIDTPGIYSLMPYTPDETVACDFLLHHGHDVILNVVDCTALQRSLFLTTQLAELHAPIVVALNMCDEAQALGIKIDRTQLEKEFHFPFVEISAAKNFGVEKLVQVCANAAKESNDTRQKPTQNIDFSEEASAKRYEKVEKIAKVVTVRAAPTPKITKRRALSEKIDAVVLNKWLAFPVFALIMFATFYLSTGGLGAFLSDVINQAITPNLQTALSRALANFGSKQLASLVVDGIVAGVMSVVSFLPQVTILFGLISALEASGYMSRIAFITDRALRSVGLNGRSFVSLLLGCGCSVPAIISTRTIKNLDEKHATVTLAPFTPCSAKLAIIAFFTADIFHGNAFIAVSFYFLALFTIVLSGLILKTFRGKKENDDAFALEMPSYRVPKFSNVAKQMCQRAKSFLVKAGTVIFAASVILWFLQHFNGRLQWSTTENSLLATIGKIVAPLFYPLGFNDVGFGWQFAVSTLTGLSAKETVIATLQLLLPCETEKCISALGAYSFVAYNLLSAPCVAAISAGFSEQGVRGGIRSLIFQVTIAYAVSLAIYQLGTAYLQNRKAFAAAIIFVVIALMTVTAVHVAKTHRACHDCENCTACANARKCRKIHR